MIREGTGIGGGGGGGGGGGIPLERAAHFLDCLTCGVGFP